jgi:hypothetical protein
MSPKESLALFRSVDWQQVFLYLFAILIGIITGCFIAGPQAIQVDDPITTLATIAAAAGTWAVGVGANRYAKATHDLQRLQAEEAHYGHYAALSTLTVRVKIARDLFPLTSDKMKEEKKTQGAMHMVLDASESLIPSVVASSTILRVPESLRAQLLALDGGIAMYRVAVNDFRLRHERASVTPSQAASTAFDHAMRQLDGIGKIADEIGLALDELRPPLA